MLVKAPTYSFFSSCFLSFSRFVPPHALALSLFYPHHVFVSHFSFYIPEIFVIHGKWVPHFELNFSNTKYCSPMFLAMLLNNV